jgi:hypothetical protein
MRRDSAVGIATGYGLYGQWVGVRVPVGVRFFSAASGAHPASYRMDTGALSGRGVKRPGREAGHSPPASAEVKNTWTYTSTPPCLIS